MPYAVNSDRQIIYRTPGATRSVLVALPVDIKASEELVALSNRGRTAGAVHTERPPGSVTVINEAAVNRVVAARDLYREKCLQLVGDHCYDGEDDQPLPERPGDDTILEWLENLVDSLRSSVSFNSSHITRLEQMIRELRAAVARSVTTEASLRAHYENALTDLNRANRELAEMRAMTGPVPFERGIVAYRGYDNAVVQWPSPDNTGFAVGIEVLVVPVNGTRTPDEKVGDPQYINAG